MKRLSWIALLFALLFASLIMMPAFLSGQFGPYPLMKNGDVLDIVTPIILIPLYWLLFQLAPNQLPSQRLTLLFMALAAAWAAGQGMHLSANSIGHLLSDMKDSDIYQLTGFYDEDLSHYVWHSGIVGLSALILIRQWRNPFSGSTEGLGAVIAGGLVYGFTYAAAVLEAGTAPLGLSFAIIVTAFGLIWGRRQFNHQPMTVFFVTGYALATLLFFVWLIWQGGLIEPSAAGFIE
jgi:hypothetical protein